MSELFEALQKAQRDADAQRGPDGERRTNNGDESGGVPAEDLRPVARSSRTPTPSATPRKRFGRVRRWLGGAEQNGNGRSHSSFVIVPPTGSEIAEQFRVLRTRIETTGRGTFMVTSALDQEGKSLCAGNLAIALARSIGAGVILVDADLRHPSIATAFNLPSGPGLVEYLLGEVEWSDCLRPTQHEGLQILPAGRGSSMSTELLGSDRMIRLVEDLKSRFPDHHILLDAPPLLLTADPLVLARHVDHVLLVVRARLTPRDAVLKAIEILGPERFLGIVLNDVAHNISHYYHYRHYPYGGTEAAQ